MKAQVTQAHYLCQTDNNLLCGFIDFYFYFLANLQT